MSHSKFFHSYGNVNLAGERLQNLGLFSALRTFGQGGIFIVPHLMWHGASVFPVSSEGPPHTPHLVASYDTCGDAENLISSINALFEVLLANQELLLKDCHRRLQSEATSTSKAMSKISKLSYTCKASAPLYSRKYSVKNRFSAPLHVERSDSI
jgi:hypothetical protein